MTVDISRLPEREQKIFHTGVAVGIAAFVDVAADVIDEETVRYTVAAFKESFPQLLDGLDEPKITVDDRWIITFSLS